MDKIEEIDLKNLYRTIAILKNEVKMEEETLKGMKQDSVSKELIETGIFHKKKEIDYLESIANGTAPESDWFFEKAIKINEKDKKIDEIPLENGHVGCIAGYKINEPVKENLFLIRGLENFSVTESDILSYLDKTSEKTLTITVRNNIPNTPIIKFNEYTRGEQEKIENIKIDILDPTLVTIYTMEYKNVKFISMGNIKGNYSSSEPQTFDVTFSYEDRGMSLAVEK